MERDTANQDIVPAYGSGAAEHRFSEALQEWRSRSKAGEVCGMYRCDQKPNLSCPKCGNYYCDEHIVLHSHRSEESMGW